MKKSVIVLYMLFSLISCLNADGENSSNVSSLGSFFLNDAYEELTGSLNVEDRHFYMSVHYINKDLKVFDKAIVYEKIDGEYSIHLKLVNLAFYDSEGSIISDYNNASELKGFSTRYNYPADSQYLSGIIFDGHFGETLYTSDPFYINWDPGINKFIKFVIDWNSL